MSRSTGLLVILVSLLGASQCSNLYTVVAPGTVRSNSEYKVALTVYGTENPITFLVKLFGPSLEQSKSVEVQPFTSEILTFDIPTLTGDEYNLKIVGSGGVEFEKESKLAVSQKQASVLIQTDKGLYKPGDLVRYRVLLLDENIRPAVIKGPIDIQISDGNQNIIKQLKNVNSTHGVYTGELQLSALPVLGKWHINVDSNGSTQTKAFGVAEYVLPRFEVTVDAERNAYVEFGTIRATIRARYTYGKPVKGEAEVTMRKKYPYGDYRESKKVVAIDGKAPIVLEFPFKDERNFDYQMVIEAVVTEKLTGNKQNGSAEFMLHRFTYRIYQDDVRPTFEPGVPVEVKFTVFYDGGNRITDSKYRLKVEVFEDYNDKKFNESEFTVDSNGNVKAILTIPDIPKVWLVASYTNMTYVHQYGWLYRKGDEPLQTAYYHEQETPLQAHIKTEKPNLDNDVEVEVTSEKEMDHILYQVIGRGNILLSNMITEIPNKKRHTFSFKPTIKMIPTAYLFVQSVKDGELLWHEATIEFGENLKNKISLETAEQAKPGEDVSIKVKTSPDAYVGLLGVDQGVLVLRKGNDLRKWDVFSQLREYTSNQYDWRRQRNGEPGNQAGLVTFTNANYTLQPEDVFDYDDCSNCFLLSSPVTPGPPDKRNLDPEPTFEQTLRKEFPETWIWDLNDTMSGPNGEIFIQKKVPDTITSWVITGFSMHDENGLGLTDEPTKLKVFQPFFVSINLPYSVKRGEVIAISAVVFNYMDKTLDTEVTMENSNDEFDFTEATNEVVENPKHEVKRTKRLTVTGQSGGTVSFMIRPKSLGHISIKVTAVSPLAGDAVLKMLPVVPEGVTEYVNKATLIDLRETTEQKLEMTIEIPENAVPNSTHIGAVIVGDLLGPTIKNLDSLVRKPYGCGEQNMINFVPNILVMQYLENIGKLTPAIEGKTKKFMEIGYQRELTYKHDDGSYSVFGKSDKSGSTWLTAYVARSFRQAAKYIQIDEKVMNEALDFLAKNQNANGSFTEVGKVVQKQHASENQNGIALTAFVVLAFIQNAEKYPEYKSNIDKALDYIEKNVETSGDIYSLAISSYAMNVAKASAKEDFIKKLESRATSDNGRKWWAKPETEEFKKICGDWLYLIPRSTNVETTGYGMLALLENGLITDTLPVLRWLISQRNSNGGFKSTQDTVVGLSALVKFSEKVSSQDPKMDIDFEYDGHKTTSKIDKDNAILLQSYEIPPSTRNVDVNAKGNGFGLFQISYQFNLNDAQASPGFKLEPVVDSVSTTGFLKLSVCVSYVPATGEEQESNMGVMEVSLPSGFTVDQDALAGVAGEERIKKVETKNEETVAVIYFDSLNSEEICPIVQAYKTYKVAQLKPAPVVVYDYYDDTLSSRKFYSPPESSLCDICEGEECGTDCLQKT